jgi:hypothetical protein
MKMFIPVSLLMTPELSPTLRLWIHNQPLNDEVQPQSMPTTTDNGLGLLLVLYLAYHALHSLRSSLGNLFRPLRRLF